MSSEADTHEITTEPATVEQLAAGWPSRRQPPAAPGDDPDRSGEAPQSNDANRPAERLDDEGFPSRAEMLGVRGDALRDA